MLNQGDWVGKLVIFAITALVLSLRLRQVGKDRPFRLDRLWIVPALYGAVALLAFHHAPPHGIAWFYCLIAFALGGVLGWYRGALVAIHVDPRTHELGQRTSPAAMLFVLAIVLVRLGARTLAVEMGVGDHMLLVISDVLIAFALGFLPVQRLEMGLRAARLLRDARGS
ncbi:MAG: DUF1453 family protein [Sphingobium sp.]